jgi:hypothetical protein
LLQILRGLDGFEGKSTGGRMRGRALLRTVARPLLSATAVILAPVLRLLALYGFGSTHLLRKGVLPLPVHYYSPVPDVDDLMDRDVWSKQSEMPGVTFDVPAQLAVLERLGGRFSAECLWPLTATGNAAEFHLANENFSFGCAAALHCMLRDLRPARVIEIGSGNSSKVIARALGLNMRESSVRASYKVIDPYPDKALLSSLPWPCDCRSQRVERVELETFSELRDNDVLFIDSGHTVRIGSDVNFLFLEVIPRLAPGVVVHVHDINLPYEYDRPYVAGVEGTFRRLWTEAYLLQAFLAFNAEWEILLAMRYLQTAHPAEFRRAFPQFDASIHRLVSSSLWMRRRPQVLARP